MKTVAWLVPSLIEGSGGHRTILQNAEYLQAHGYRTVIYLENNDGMGARTSPSDHVWNIFGYRFADVRVGWGEIEPCDIVFATVWYSAKVVRDLRFACRKLYFVQDWEAAFNPMGDTYLMAENSYRYGLSPVTIGRWLRHELNERFSIQGAHFDFCADTSIYRPLSNVEKELAICFICQPEKPRRGANLGIETLGIVKHVMPDVKIYLYGSRARTNVWFEHTDLGLLDLHECNALYNRSAVGFCISSSNPSRIPFEMMAAGLPVVELHRENTLYDLPENASLLCDQNPESLAEGLLTLLRDAPRRAEMGRAASAFMVDRPLEMGMRQFLQAVQEISEKPLRDGFAAVSIEPTYRSAPIVATPFLNSTSSDYREVVRQAHRNSRKPTALKRFLSSFRSV
ncbi:glycosyltransferase family protein [Burkholderia lata]|uniref:rhamnosyltransferase WsaF family glycosyltransferase n=1 Tax=Burkholderia lata (strain ATCC 17760 / DSM 23089 / LMG 22485 / NCIMB 9086 / R18194 / 383) TaxID=482957 RepID=UPI000AE5DC13|nr:glycosyltransferase family 1 protein [Burkholderia lata]